MRLLKPGDTVFSYAFGRIGAIGHVTGCAERSPKPSGFLDYWSDDGWMVDVSFIDAPLPMEPKAHIEAIGPMLPAKYSPLKRDGNGNQGCYLAQISDALGHVLLALLHVDTPALAEDPAPYDLRKETDAGALDDIHSVESDTSIPETERVQLAKARVGQGLFRKRVILLDHACRVTGVTDTRVLIASHIKPWRSASNPERISGFNGILLSPHVDALFDEQLITFENDGRIRVHASLPREVLDRWSIDPGKSTGPFRKEQEPFLAYHRQLFARKQH
ncbi:MAG TPA: HNH endonuclease [Rhodanobacteraceae bacterium]